MNRIFLSVAVLFFCCQINIAQAINLDNEKQDKWHGFTRTTFSFNNRTASIVEPTQALNGKPWVWRAYFPDWHTDIDSILLTKGFHIAYINTNDMFGSPESMQIWDAFYNYMVSEKGFAPKVALEGVSRGGLYVYNWAKRNPLKVSCIYAEAPVCDFKSWPGGKGISKGSPPDWELTLKNYGFTEAEALAYRDNPIDNLGGLAAVKVPVLHSIGLSDKIVPNSENTFILVNNYIKLGGIATVVPMTKGEQTLEGHHFIIENPEKIAAFIESNSYPVKSILEPSIFHVMRSTMSNSFIKFSKEKQGRVAFMGGSITEGSGWREKVCSYLVEKFPDTKFEFINAGISSTGSTPGAFRLENEVLSKGPIDLFFEEAAVNDKTNGFNTIGQIRGMEGIIRHARINNPLMDIVVMHFVDPEKIAEYKTGIIPNEIQNHEKVADHYKINTINLAKEVTTRIDAGEFTWKDDFKDLHPSTYGHEIYTRSIKSFLNNAYAKMDSSVQYAQHNIPAILDPFSYAGGDYLPVTAASSLSGWTVVQSWKPNDGAGTRKQYVDIPALIAEKPAAELKLKFSGKAIGICIASGPDAGIIEYSVDGRKFKQVDLFTQWSSGLHLPWYIMLEDELKKKSHTLVIRISSEKNQKSKGNSCRILHFLVNQ